MPPKPVLTFSEALASITAKGQVPQQQSSTPTQNPTPRTMTGTIPFTMTNAQALGHSSTPPAAAQAPQQRPPILGLNTSPSSGTIPSSRSDLQALSQSSSQPATTQALQQNLSVPQQPLPSFGSISSLTSNSQTLGQSSSQPATTQAPQQKLAVPQKPLPSSGTMLFTMTNAQALGHSSSPPAAFKAPPAASAPRPAPAPEAEASSSIRSKKFGSLSSMVKLDEQTASFLGGKSSTTANAPAEKPAMVPQPTTSGSSVPAFGLANALQVKGQAVEKPSSAPGWTLPPPQIATVVATNPSVAYPQASNAAPPTSWQAPIAVQGPPRRSYDPNLVELELIEWWKAEPQAFETLIGLYFQHSGRHPQEVGGRMHTALRSQAWMLDPRRQDILEKNPNAPIGGWLPIANNARFQGIMALISQGYQAALEGAIGWWSVQPEPQRWGVDRVLRKAGWVTDCDLLIRPDWDVMHEIFRMNEGTEKASLMSRAMAESPRWYDFCLKHMFCGLYSFKRKRVAESDEEERVSVYYTEKGRIEEVHPIPKQSPAKRQAMDADYGRPTQVHGVPPEERAYDSKGNRLPWGLEWHDDHPNARGQRRHIEEKGPFGKSNRRKGSSRTRTATPAKKENPTLDGFEKALKFTLSQEAQSQQGNPPSTRIQNDTNLASQHNISLNKQPTQVMIFGYSTDSQWAALDAYERCSFGIICEDYARTPPESARRYPTAFSSLPVRRSLTKTERSMAFKYDGGEHWVKVTFDSAEAAERAIESSPRQIYGHWVYAQLYHGNKAEKDEPIPIEEGERELGRPRHKPHTVGASFAHRANAQQPGGSTLPRSFTVDPSAQAGADQAIDSSPSSSTATSGTATGAEYPDLRQRNVPQPESRTQANQQQPRNEQQQQQRDPRMMRHFPDIPRTILRPASEAFLPQPTWWERQAKWLSDMGLLPGEVIGNGIPLTEDGNVDLARASFYWKFFYWIDNHFGTDICGLKDDD